MEWLELHKLYKETAEILKKEYFCYFTNLKPGENMTVEKSCIEATFLNFGQPIPTADRLNGFKIKSETINVPENAKDFKDVMAFFRKFKIDFKIFRHKDEIWIESDEGYGYVSV
jgi:hypothetical protein